VLLRLPTIDPPEAEAIATAENIFSAVAVASASGGSIIGSLENATDEKKISEKTFRGFKVSNLWYGLSARVIYSRNRDQMSAA